jgi:tagatose-1,6-bisphosphate aldolase
VSERNGQPITSRGIRLPWPAAVVVCGFICTGAVWAHGVERDLTDRAAGEVVITKRLERIDAKLDALLLRFGVPVPKPAKED